MLTPWCVIHSKPILYIELVYNCTFNGHYLHLKDTTTSIIYIFSISFSSALHQILIDLPGSNKLSFVWFLIFTWRTCTLCLCLNLYTYFFSSACLFVCLFVCSFTVCVFLTFFLPLALTIICQNSMKLRWLRHCFFFSLPKWHMLSNLVFVVVLLWEGKGP